MKARPLIIAGISLLAVVALAQRRWSWRYDEDVRTAREVPSRSTGTPTWTNLPGFEKDAFTFVRIRYDQMGYRRGNGWATDLPDSDLNLSFRLQQMTSIKVDPNGRIINLTDADLAEFPFIY